MGGVNQYAVNGDGSTYYNFSKFTYSSHSMITTCGFTVTLVNGAVLYCNEQQSFALGQYRAYLKTTSDPQGRTATLNYGLTNGVMRLTNYVDFSNYKTTLFYQGSSIDKVTAIVDPFGRTNSFTYSTNGFLVGITNPLSFGSTFTYDSQGMITNLSTPYGNTAFLYSVNTNIGNVVTRSMQVVLPSSGKQLYIYRDQSTYLNSTSSIPLLPSSYSTNELPNTGSFTNTFDNTWMDARNSFYWSPHNFDQLSAAFRSSGNFSDLSTNDYKLARLRHWLRQAQYVDALSGTLSIQRDSSPDGLQDGQKTWYDYWGKSPTIDTNGTTNWYSVGSSPSPKFVAFRLPNGDTRYTYQEYNAQGNPTLGVSTWSPTGGGVQTRTNTFLYDSINGIDLIGV